MLGQLRPHLGHRLRATPPRTSRARASRTLRPTPVVPLPCARPWHCENQRPHWPEPRHIRPPHAHTSCREEEEELVVYLHFFIIPLDMWGPDGSEMEVEVQLYQTL